MAPPAAALAAGYEELGGSASQPLSATAWLRSVPASAKASLRRKTWLIRLAGLALLLGAFLALTLTLGRHDTLRAVLIWIHAHTVAGCVIFALLYTAFTICFLPPALLAACAGAIYGLLPAMPLVWACAIVGETVSFLLGRFLLRRWVAELTGGWPMWLALNAALREDGWKLVALLRLSPLMPFSIINYALGSSSLPFAHYFWPSVFGILPSMFIYIWAGSLAADVSEALSGGSTSAPPAAKVVIIVVTGVSALLVVVLSGVYTKRAIDSRLASVTVAEGSVVLEQHALLAEPGARGVVVSVEALQAHVVADAQQQQHGGAGGCGWRGLLPGRWQAGRSGKEDDDDSSSNADGAAHGQRTACCSSSSSGGAAAAPE